MSRSFLIIALFFGSAILATMICIYILILKPLQTKSPEPLDVTPIVTLYQNTELTDDLFAKGNKLYSIHCFDCHGLQGKGGTAPALQNNLWLKASKDDALIDILVNGRPAKGMPGWGNRITSQDIVILAKTIKKFNQKTDAE